MRRTQQTSSIEALHNNRFTVFLYSFFMDYIYCVCIHGRDVPPHQLSYTYIHIWKAHVDGNERYPKTVGFVDRQVIWSNDPRHFFPVRLIVEQKKRKKKNRGARSCCFARNFSFPDKSAGRVLFPTRGVPNGANTRRRRRRRVRVCSN